MKKITKNNAFKRIKLQKLDRDKNMTQKELLNQLKAEFMESEKKPINIPSIENKILNISYADNSNTQKLDVFMPKEKGTFPAVILIHGGAYSLGDKSMTYLLVKKLVENGFVAVPINYRLSGEAIFPAPVHDCKAALRYIRANAEKYNINPEKIGAWGPSAGGYFSAMLGTSSENDLMNGTLGDYPKISTKVQAVIDWFGPIDFSTMIPQAKMLGYPSDYDVESETLFIGAEASDPANYELVTKANPTTYLTKNTPPFWVEVGSQDPIVPYLQSEDFAEDLTNVLGTEKVEFTILDGVGHAAKQFYTEENLNKMIRFLEKYLK